MDKHLLAVVTLIVIISSSIAIYVLNPDSATNKIPVGSEAKKAVNQAKHAYQLKIEKKEDLSDGPCLSNDLMPGWVADIAHLPRRPVDDLPQNQCPAFLEGRAKHFVELDSDGNLIRAK